MRLLLVVGVAFALGGCAVLPVPPAVTIASYAADGVSYLATGKSLTDHAVSGVTGEDCVLFRAAELENPCRDYVKPDSQLAVELETDYGGEAVSTQLADADLAAGDGGTRLAARRTRSVTLASAEAKRRYVVIGSFRQRANAERARRRHASLGATIVPARVRGRSFYRVVTTREAAHRTVASEERWTIARCTRTRRRGACLDHASAARVRAEAERRGAHPVFAGPAAPANQGSPERIAATPPRHRSADRGIFGG